jgi:hypothetical protein
MFSGSSVPPSKPNDTISQVEFRVAGFESHQQKFSHHIPYASSSLFLIPHVGEVQQRILEDPTDQWFLSVPLGLINYFSKRGDQLLFNQVPYKTKLAEFVSHFGTTCNNLKIFIVFSKKPFLLCFSTKLYKDTSKTHLININCLYINFIPS